MVKQRAGYHACILAITASVLIWSAIRPTGPYTWILEVAPAVLPIFNLIFTYKYFQFTTLSYFIFSTAFFLSC